MTKLQLVSGTDLYENDQLYTTADYTCLNLRMIRSIVAHICSRVHVATN